MAVKLPKIIEEDWQKSFDQLKIFSTGRLFRVVGPVLIGIELTKLPRTEEYRPHFVLYSLWKENNNENLKYPILVREPYRKNELQFRIPFQTHSANFAEVSHAIREQFPILLKQQVFLTEILDIINKHASLPPLSVAPNSYLQALLQESKLMIALLTDKTEAVRIFNLDIASRKWDTNHFKMCNVNFETWLEKMRSSFDFPDTIRDRVRANLAAPKISVLPNIELSIR